MRIAIDTTYLLPLIGIAIKGLPDNIILELISRKYRVYINHITIFDLIAKGAKYVTRGLLSPTRVLRGVNAIVYDERIEKVSLEDSDVLALAFKLRTRIDDFIDCLIVSTAIHYSNVLLTEDSTIIKLVDNTWFKEVVQALNPDFKILDYEGFKEKYLKVSK